MKNLIFIWFLPFFIFANNGEKSAFESMPEELHIEVNKYLKLKDLYILSILNKEMQKKFPQIFTNLLGHNKNIVFKVDLDPGSINYEREKAKLNWLSTIVINPVLSLAVESLRSENIDEILPYFSNVVLLNILFARLKSSDFLKIGSSIYLKNLKHLKIMHTDLNGKDIKELIKGENFKKLDSFGIYHRINNNMAKILASSDALDNLKSLSLINTNIDNEGAVALAHSNHLSKLEVLDLRDNKIRLDGVKALLESIKLQNLKTLRISQIYLRKLQIEELKSLDEKEILFLE